MTWIHLIDWLTGLASFGVKFVGFPSQIRRNRRQGTGTTATFAAAMCASYLLWVIHGVAVGDWVEILSQGVGVVTTGILVWQSIKSAATG